MLSKPADSKDAAHPDFRDKKPRKKFQRKSFWNFNGSAKTTPIFLYVAHVRVASRSVQERYAKREYIPVDAEECVHWS